MTDPVISTDPTTLHLIAPDEGALVDGRAVTFEWSDAPAVSSYRLQVALDADFSRLHVDAEVGTATTITLYDLFAPDGSRVFWRVAAIDQSGVTHLPTGTFNVLAERIPAPSSGPRPEATPPRDPHAPIPIVPADGSVTDGLATTFEWEPAALATSYRLQVAQDPAFRELQFDADLGKTQSITLYDLLPVDGPEMVWRVQARHQEHTTWSPTVRFRAVSDFAEVARRKPEYGPARSPVAGAGALTTAPGSMDAYGTRSTMGLVALWVAGSLALALLILLKILLT